MFWRYLSALLNLIKEIAMCHRPNNDPVQEHSAGDLYPFVIFRQDKDGVSTWGILGPSITATGYESHEHARDAAQLFKYALMLYR